MDVAISLCLGQAQAIRQAVRLWRPDAPRTGSLLLSAEVMRDAVARLGDVAARVMQEAWEDLSAGRVADAQATGAVLDRLLSAVGETLYTVEEHAGALRRAGLPVPDMSALGRTRVQLAWEVERFRDGWPTIPEEEAAGGEPEEEEEPEELAYDLGGGD